MYCSTAGALPNSFCFHCRRGPPAINSRFDRDGFVQWATGGRLSTPPATADRPSARVGGATVPLCQPWQRATPPSCPCPRRTVAGSGVGGTDSWSDSFCITYTCSPSGRLPPALFILIFWAVVSRVPRPPLLRISTVEPRTTPSVVGCSCLTVFATEHAPGRRCPRRPRRQACPQPRNSFSQVAEGGGRGTCMDGVV